MKISRIEIYQHPLNVVNGPYVYSGGSIDTITTTLVKIVADNGNIGWGEVCPLGPTYQPAHAAGALAALQELVPMLIGLEALPRPVSLRMDELLAGHRYAKAAIDIALFDLLGKTLKQPVHVLLGGALRKQIPSYYAISIMSPEETARTVKTKQQEGFTALQIKIGCGDIRQDVEVLRHANAVLAPGVSLAADANRALSSADFLHLSRMLADLPIAFEQPCNRIEEMVAIRHRIQHPIYLDETTEDTATILSLLGSGHCEGLGMKLTRVGGLSPMLTVRDMAEARRIPISSDDSWGGDIIAAACVHLGATINPRYFRGTWIAAPYIDHHYDPNNGISITDGHIHVPQGEGLGITPDEDLFGKPVVAF